MSDRKPFTRVSDLRNWLGLSENGIKLYENEGILQPNRNEANNYRRLEISDGDRMFRSRILTSYGFSIKETSDILLNQTLGEQLNTYTDKQDDLTEEILELTCKLRHLKKMQDIIREIQKDPKKCEIVNDIDAYFLPVHDQYQNKTEGTADCTDWLKEMPFVTSTVLFDPIEQEYPIFWFGPSVSRHNAFRLDIPLENAVRLGGKSQHYVRGFCKYNLDENISYKDYAHLLEYAQKNKLKPYGFAITRHIVLEKINENGTVYDETFILVKQ